MKIGEENADVSAASVSWERPSRAGRTDRFTAIYAAWYLPFLIAIWWGWLRPDWNWERMEFIGFGLLCLATICFLGLKLVLRQWRKALSVLGAPIIALAPSVALAHLGVTPDSVRFALTRQTYLDDIAKGKEQGGEPRIRTFVWDGSFSGKTYRTLVYDETDEIGRPAGAQSPVWQERVRTLCVEKKECIDLRPAESDESVSLTTLDGHFYLLENALPNAFP